MLDLNVLGQWCFRPITFLAFIDGAFKLSLYLACVSAFSFDLSTQSFVKFLKIQKNHYHFWYVNFGQLILFLDNLNKLFIQSFVFIVELSIFLVINFEGSFKRSMRWNHDSIYFQIFEEIQSLFWHWTA